jgi:O-methyltransferase involved in polyketide biosynthesis
MYSRAGDDAANVERSHRWRQGGGLVFDYGVPPDVAPAAHRVQGAGRAPGRVGEPFIGFFDPPELVAAVQRAGFSRVDDLSPPDLTARFLSNRTDGLRLSGLGHILCARA